MRTVRTVREPSGSSGPDSGLGNRPDCPARSIEPDSVRRVRRGLRSVLTRRKREGDRMAPDPSPAPHPPSHLPHQAPANFALPEKRPKGDR